MLLWFSLASGPQNPLPVSGFWITHPGLKLENLGTGMGRSALFINKHCMMSTDRLHVTQSCTPSRQKQKGEPCVGAWGPAFCRGGESSKPANSLNSLPKTMRRLKTENPDWEQNTRSWRRWITKQQRFCFHTNILGTNTRVMCKVSRIASRRSWSHYSLGMQGLRFRCWGHSSHAMRLCVLFLGDWRSYVGPHDTTQW